MSKTSSKIIIIGMLVAGIALFSYFSIFTIPALAPVTYENNENPNGNSATMGESALEEPSEALPITTHIKTPEPLRAIYMTSWVAGTSDWRASLVDFIEKTELNALVIDIKDYSGRIAFEVSDPLLKKFGAEEIRIPDIREFIEILHKKQIYVIGRITVFQDPHLVSKRPDLAVKRDSDRTIPWKDYKGISYLDPGAREAWDYIIALAKESYALGFDELNFDYIRFPSDGDMRDIYYPFSEERILSDWKYGKAKVIRDFFKYLHEGLKDTGAVLSADLFGMVTTNSDDLNVGQVLEYAAPYFDYIAPMVYPSHYPKNFNGYADPNDYPHEVVEYSMASAVKRLKSNTTFVKELGDESIASTSPQLYTKETFDPLKLRPWLQDFDYGGNYDVEEVRAQIQATYDAGLTSWMLWNPSNKYTRGAILPAE